MLNFKFSGKELASDLLRREEKRISLSEKQRVKKYSPPFGKFESVARSSFFWRGNSEYRRSEEKDLFLLNL